MTELSDELLVAYVDGQLARKKSEAIGRVLAEDKVAGARAETLREAQRKLELAFDAMLASEWSEIESSAAEQALTDYETLIRRYARWSRKRIALVCGLAFAVGAGAGYAATLLSPLMLL